MSKAKQPNVMFKIKPANIKGCNMRKRIVWNKQHESENYVGTAVVLIGYCPDTVPYFMAMAGVVLKSFPDADVNQMTCSKVTVSHYIKGYTVLLAPVKGPKRKVRGWDEGSIDFNY